MRCDAFQGEGKLVLGRAGVVERAGRAVGIEHVAEVNALDVFFFDVLGAEETDLLLYGENDSDFAMRDVHLLHEGDAFQDGGHAGLVIAAQDGVAFRGEDAALQDGLDVLAVFDAVHVRGECDGGKAWGIAIPDGDQIAAVPAIDGAVIVFDDLRGAEAFQLLFQIFADFTLAFARRVEGDKLREGAFHSFCIDHSKTSFLENDRDTFIISQKGREEGSGCRVQGSRKLGMRN